MFASLLVATALAAAPASPAVRLPLHWGQTVSEVKGALTRLNAGRDVWLTPVSKAGTAEQRYVIGGMEEADSGALVGTRTVTFRDGRLVSIGISLARSEDPGRPKGDALRRDLTSRYGPPERKTERPGNKEFLGPVEETVWLEGDTEVTLISSPEVGPLAIEYAHIAPDTNGAAR